jgi:hypothetical protein
MGSDGAVMTGRRRRVKFFNAVCNLYSITKLYMQEEKAYDL